MRISEKRTNDEIISFQWQCIVHSSFLLVFTPRLRSRGGAEKKVQHMRIRRRTLAERMNLYGAGMLTIMSELTSVADFCISHSNFEIKHSLPKM
jgi:hypothetical protein